LGQNTKQDCKNKEFSHIPAHLMGYPTQCCNIPLSAGSFHMLMLRRYHVLLDKMVGVQLSRQQANYNLDYIYELSLSWQRSKARVCYCFDTSIIRMMQGRIRITIPA